MDTLTLHRDGNYQVVLAPAGKPGRHGQGYAIRCQNEVSDDYDTVLLTAADWCKVAIKLMLECPEAKDPIGLCTYKNHSYGDELEARGKTLGRSGSWQVCLSEAIGGDSEGRMLLEWTQSRTIGEGLSLIEIGAAFKCLIGDLSAIAEREKDY